MQLRYVFSELGQGLRRNVSMHIAVVLTLFVSLTLVGLGVLLNQQAEQGRATTSATSSRSPSSCAATATTNPTCTGEVTDAQKEAIERGHRGQPRGRDYHFESKEEAFEKVKELYGEEYDGPRRARTAADMPESYWITLKDPEEFEGITSAVVGLDGVSQIRDQREMLKPIYATIDALKYGASAIAAFLLSRRCCWSPTRSGSRRSRGARRSGSCGWSAPPRSTSRCRSCSRRWSPR